jgi:hypothetical protein
MPVFNNILAGASGQTTGYDIDQSLRFEDGDSPELVRSVTVAGNRRTSTWSAWVKIGWSTFSNDAGTIEPTHTLFCCGNSDGRWNVGFSNATAINNNLPQLFIGQRDSGGGQAFEVSSTQAFRDPSAWYHIVVVMDTNQSTNTNRVKAYINGERITDWGVTSWPSQNYDSDCFRTADPVVKVRVGSTVTNSNTGDRFWDGYIAEVNVVDGTALDASYFGETNSATNQWVPVEYAGSYGTNGFYLPFSSTELANSFSDSSTDCGDGSPCYAGDTKLLLHFDGADDGTSFPDSSREGHSITRTGTVTKTGQKKFGTASAYFDGNDGLTTSDTSDFTFGTDPFTIECWVYVTSGAAFNTPSASDAGFLFCGDSSATSTRSVEFTIYRGELRAGLYNSDSSSATYISGGTINDATWYHVALSRTASDAWAIYVDGSRVATSSTTKTLPQNANSGQIAIGARIEGGSLGQYFDGYIDDYRITKGVGRYSGASFTAPTAAFTNPTKSITANGDVTNTRAQSKIGNSSIYFDGTGDYLSTASSGLGLTGDYTIECWFNTASSTSDNGIISNKYNNSSFNGNFSLRLNDGGNSNDIAFRPYNGTVAEGGLVTSGTGAWSDNTWTHVAVVRSGSGTGNVKMYINGSLAGTSSGASSSTILGNAGDLNIGRQESASAGTNYLNGYMDEIRISSSARYTGTFTPSTTAFTADANTLLLIHSDFNGGLGSDGSGNKNDFAPTNLVVTDQVLDSPTNNFATFNPLVRSSSNSNYSEGNLYATDNGSGDWEVRLGTIPLPETGKWYWECRVGNGNAYIGILDEGENITVTNPSGGVIWYGDDGRKRIDGTFSSYGAGYGSANVLGVAVDMDASPRTIEFYKDNTSQGSITITGDCATGTVIPYITSIVQSWINFGQDSSFAGSKTSQGNGGDGEDFFYTPPTGYKALNTDNLPDVSIKPEEHFQTVLYTGDGTTNHAITGVGFQPDLVWYKVRSTTGHNNLYDSVRGVQKVVYSDLTNAEATSTGTQDLYAFGADGFTVGSNFQTICNTSGETFASWNWKAASSNTSVSAGSIDGTNPTIACTRRTNTTAGFSIVSYTGQSAAGTVSHGLSQAPEMIILKNRDQGVFWAGYVEALGNTKSISLNDTGAAYTEKTWNDTSPTSTVFSIGAQSETSSGRFNVAGEKFIAYCFHSVDGYSKVGSYIGNGLADGTFVYTGFKPAFLLIKRITGVQDWMLADNKTSPYNQTEYMLRPAQDAAQQSGNTIDILSNGFKPRLSGNAFNASGESYLVLAFAESPFKYSNAR